MIFSDKLKYIILYIYVITDGNLLPTDKRPVLDSPKTIDTITLSETPNIHQDNPFGIKGTEYFNNIFFVFLSYDFIEIYL